MQELKGYEFEIIPDEKSIGFVLVFTLVLSLLITFDLGINVASADDTELQAIVGYWNNDMSSVTIGIAGWGCNGAIS